MLTFLTINNIKTYLVVIAAIGVVWLYKDRQIQKAEFERQSENLSNIRKFDSLRYASQTYTKKELQEYLAFQRKDLEAFLDQNRISTRKIERIISQELNFRDTTRNDVDLQPVLEAIKNQKSIKIPVTDSTSCMIIKGYVAFENDTLNLNITDRQFKNKSDVITYWERNQWQFMGIKSRLFGRKKATVIIKDACGKTETIVIDRKK